MLNANYRDDGLPFTPFDADKGAECEIAEIKDEEGAVWGVFAVPSAADPAVQRGVPAD